MFGKFVELLTVALDKHAPVVTKTIQNRQNNQASKRWKSKKLRVLINEKRRLFNNWMKVKTDEARKEFNKLRNKVNRALREKENAFTKDFFENLPDCKSQWNFINKKLNRHQHEKSI